MDPMGFAPAMIGPFVSTLYSLGQWNGFSKHEAKKQRQPVVEVSPVQTKQSMYGICWVLPSRIKSSKSRFYIGPPHQTCNNPGGHCYWEGATPKVYLPTFTFTPHINHTVL